MGDPRRANGHRRDQVVRRVKAEESDCWICGEAVDKSLPPYLPGSPEVDEIVPDAAAVRAQARVNFRRARWRHVAPQ